MHRVTRVFPAGAVNLSLLNGRNRPVGKGVGVELSSGGGKSLSIYRAIHERKHPTLGIRPSYVQTVRTEGMTGFTVERYLLHRDKVVCWQPVPSS